MNGGATTAVLTFMGATEVVSGQVDTVLSFAIGLLSGAVNTFLTQQAMYLF